MYRRFDLADVAIAAGRFHANHANRKPSLPCPNVLNPRKACTCVYAGTGRRDEAVYWREHILGQNCD